MPELGIEVTGANVLDLLKCAFLKHVNPWDGRSLYSTLVTAGKKRDWWGFGWVDDEM